VSDIRQALIKIAIKLSMNENLEANLLMKKKNQLTEIEE